MVLIRSMRGSLWYHRLPSNGLAPLGWRAMPAESLDLTSWDYSVGRLLWLVDVDSSGVIVPHWVIVTACLVIPAYAATRRSRRARLACPACGYDLCGTPSGGGSESKTCPECGFRPPEPAELPAARPRS
jgi:hypothetical protein